MMTLEELLAAREQARVDKDVLEYRRLGTQIQYRRHPDRAKAASQRWRENNQRKAENTNREWVRRNRESVNARSKAWRKANPKWFKEYMAKRWRENPQIRLRSLYDGRAKLFYVQGYAEVNHPVNPSLPKRGPTKRIFCKDLCGCTESELYHHMGKKPTGGYSLDHIQPCCAFDLEDPQQALKCYHYTNLRWIPWLENAKKGRMLLDDKVNPPIPFSEAIS